MDKNNDMDKMEQDTLDRLLFSIADEADDGVDYAAMLDTIYKKATARKKRSAFVKYGSMAAAAAIVLAVGGLWFAMNGGASADNGSSTPQAPMMMYSQDSDACDMETVGSTESASQASEEPAEAARPNAGNSYGYAADGEDNSQKSIAAAAGSEESGEICWAANGIILPEINFGTYYEVTKDDTDGFECSVYGCTEADAESYMADIAAMYGAKAEDGGMTITINGGFTVTLALEGDVLGISARG